MWCFSIVLATPRIIRMALGSSGSSTCTVWKRRVSAGSFSMCFLYSAKVVAPMVRSVPRASAGFSRLAASPVPAAPPAPTSVCVSSMNRMIGFGLACTSSITARRRCSNSPFMLAPACSRPTSSARSSTSFSARRHVAARDALREAFDHRGLADAGLADQDRVVLAPAHQDVDDLADLVVAADDRVHLAAARLLGQVDGELLQRLLLAHRRRRDGAAGLARRRAAADLRAVAGALPVFGRAGDDLVEAVGQVVDLDLLELARDAPAARCAARRLQHAHQQVAGAHLRCRRTSACRRPSRARPRRRCARQMSRDRWWRRAAAGRAPRSGRAASADVSSS